MLEIFLQTLPFFGVIGLGYLAGRTGFFPPEATAYLTKFVFYFALSAMIFRFSANLPLSDILDPQLVLAYFCATAVALLLVFAVGLARRLPYPEAAVEAQASVTGNLGFMALPMFTLLLGEASVGPLVLIIAVDLIVWGSLVVIVISASRDGRVSLATLRTVVLGLLKNPMIMSMSLGLIWSASELPVPGPFNDFLGILGAAATPAALFAIGASLAGKSAERMVVAGWISFAKLFIHPAMAAVAAFYVFDLDPFAATVLISAAAIPVAGNVYITAQHYGVAPARVSASILISTVVSIVTIPVVIAWVQV